MHEQIQPKWAIWKRMFNLTWDITFGKAEKKRDGPAESDLIGTRKKIMEGVFIQGFLTKAYIENNKKREGDWSKTRGSNGRGNSPVLSTWILLWSGLIRSISLVINFYEVLISLAASTRPSALQQGLPFPHSWAKQLLRVILQYNIFSVPTSPLSLIALRQPCSVWLNGH